MTPHPVALRLPDFEAWVAASPQPVAVLRWSDHAVLAANAAFETLLDLPRAALLGRAGQGDALWPQPQQRQQLWAALEQGSPAGRFTITLRGQGGVPQDLAAAAHRVQGQGEAHVVLMLAAPPDAQAALAALQATQRYVEASAPLGTWDWDRASGRIRSSPGLEALYGLAPGSFGGRFEDFARCLHPADAPRVEDFWRLAGQARSPQSMEFRIVRPDGQVRWLTTRVETTLGPDGSLLRARGLNMDVTEDRHRELRLRLSDAIIDNMAEGVKLCRADNGRIVYANARYAAMLGYGEGELVGQHVSIVNSPAETDPLETAQAILADLQRDGVWKGTVRNRRKDGQDIWVRASIASFDHDEHGMVWVTVSADITEEHLAQKARDRAAAELQRLAASVQETIEAERAALSRDLHDQLGAALAGIRMRLETVAAGLPGTAEGPRAELMAIAVMAQDAVVQTRDICSRLRPPTLDDLGIVETCRWYVSEWARHAGLRVQRQLPRLRPEPAPGVAIDLFRILQELLTNVARHARASQVSVALQGRARRLVLRVADNGVGIARQRRGQGFGLLGVRERVQRHGGSLVIESAEGGTTVTITIPQGAAA